MDAQALSTPSRIELTAPPPPIRHRIRVPTEPLLFAAVIVVLTLGIARAVPEIESASDSSVQPAVVVHASRG
jgi:hypothetical protein